MAMDLSQHFAVYGVKPTNVLVVDKDGKVYDLHTIPKVKDHYLGVPRENGEAVVAFIRLSGLEEAAKHLPPNRHGHNFSRALFIDELTTEPHERIQKWVYLARGYHPPERISFHDHPFPSTLDSDLSGM